METVDGTYLDAVGVLALDAVVGDDEGHDGRDVGRRREV
jgi:hypothetical protein